MNSKGNDIGKKDLFNLTTNKNISKYLLNTYNALDPLLHTLHLLTHFILIPTSGIYYFQIVVEIVFENDYCLSFY